MPRIFVFATAITFFLLFSPQVFADSEIVINEFYALGGSENPDWVELYNMTDSKVDIEGWQIKDETESNKIILGGYVCSHSFRKFTFSNRLNNGGDKIRLFKSGSDQTVDELTYFSQSMPTHIQGQSTGRSPDGSGSWIVLSTPTPSDDTSCDQPTPTPTPTPTPSPSPSPTQTSSTAKSPSPSPISTKSPSPTPKPSPKVLAEKDSQSSTPSAQQETPSPSPSPSAENSSPKFKVAGLLSGTGLALIGVSFALYLWYSKRLPKNENP
ncbi:MAG: lamin tail domain-containing protein [Candidatus Curtissbacteria bacterium]|nr:lamin tail domain-containing protein [Candidatus Curtissbacteria bacterium]MDZ4210050.1 lamin tail domain-containing protein [Candidatus Curtissbacteria bacterium]